jgi:hypothetical protein
MSALKQARSYLKSRLLSGCHSGLDPASIRELNLLKDTGLVLAPEIIRGPV